MTSPSFRDDPAAQRYELLVDGQLAGHADYRRHGNTLQFTHTEVQPQYEGQGLASQLAQHALDEARRRGERVQPSCPFIAEFIRKNREYVPLVPEEFRAGAGL